MVDGNIKPSINLKVVAEELANAAGTKDTMYYDETNKMYFIDGIDEDMLIANGFEFLQYASNHKPIYRRLNIFAEPNIDPAFGNIMIYKEHNNRWVGEE